MPTVNLKVSIFEAMSILKKEVPQKQDEFSDIDELLHLPHTTGYAGMKCQPENISSCMDHSMEFSIICTGTNRHAHHFLTMKIVKVNVKLSLCITKHHTMKMY
jgi:hypothetical protein